MTSLIQITSCFVVKPDCQVANQQRLHYAWLSNKDIYIYNNCWWFDFWSFLGFAHGTCHANIMQYFTSPAFLLLFFLFHNILWFSQFDYTWIMKIFSNLNQISYDLIDSQKVLLQLFENFASVSLRSHTSYPQ